MTERYRVFKIDNSYGVSDDIANYTLAWDTSKTIMDRLCDKLNKQDQQINELKEENKQLKQKMLRLYNYFKDWFEDIMPPNGFSEMWDNVKEDKKWER